MFLQKIRFLVGSIKKLPFCVNGNGGTSRFSSRTITKINNLLDFGTNKGYSLSINKVPPYKIGTVSF